MTALFAELSAEPYRFDFFQAVRRLECLGAEAGRPRVGTSARAEQDLIRFTQPPTLASGAPTVAAFGPPPLPAWFKSEQDESVLMREGATGPRPFQMSVNFFGMWGPNGPLPLHLTEYARDRQRNFNDATLVRFMDVFHHRMTSLFYRAWAVNQPVVGTDRSLSAEVPGAIDDNRPGDDRFAVYVASLIGHGLPSMRSRDAVPDVAKLHWAGHLSGDTRHAEGLESILSTHFGFPVQVLPFAGQWIDLPKENRLKMGRSKETGSLGQTAIVGSQVWDCQGQFRIRLGPMGLEQFSRMLPGEKGNKELRAWIRNYLGDQLGWEARVILASRAVPGAQLGKSGSLGWSAWLPTRSPRPDSEDLILHS